MNNYTPDTSSVLYAFVDGNKPRDEEEYLRLVAEFQDWLNEERAKAYDEGFDQGHYINPEESRDCGCRENPYRKADS